MGVNPYFMAQGASMNGSDGNGKRRVKAFYTPDVFFMQILSTQKNFKPQIVRACFHKERQYHSADRS